jgi:hypothetical protein
MAIHKLGVPTDFGMLRELIEIREQGAPLISWRTNADPTTGQEITIVDVEVVWFEHPRTSVR